MGSTSPSHINLPRVLTRPDAKPRPARLAAALMGIAIGLTVLPALPATALAPAPAAYWKLDEGSGTTASDSSGNGYHGALINGPAWQPATSCKSTSCLRFDGADDYVGAGSIPGSVFQSSFTAEAWVRLLAGSRGEDNAIVGHGSAANGQGLHLGERSGKAYFGFYNNDLAGNTPLWAGLWYHLAFVYDGAANIKKIYVNGQLDASGFSGSYTGTGGNAEIGRYPWATYSNFFGSIDEVAIHPSALSSETVLSRYAAALPTDALLDPVAQWKLDEPTGTTALDSSGNNNHGTLTGGPARQSASFCKSIGCVSFDGQDDYINVPYSPSLSLHTFSVAAWVYPRAIKPDWQPLVVKEASNGGSRNYGLWINPNSTTLHYSFQAGDCASYRSYNSAGSLAINQWNHVAMTYDGVNFRLYRNGVLDSTQYIPSEVCESSQPVKIGRELSAYIPFTGRMDEIGIYKRAISELEVGALYLSGGPPDLLARYKLDEIGGATAPDTSGNNFHATLTNGPTWQPATSCKVAGCLSFDGANDYLALPAGLYDFSQGLSVEGWVYPTSAPGWERIFDFGNGPDSDNIMLARFSTSDTWSFTIRRGGLVVAAVSVPGAFTLNQWQHFAITVDSSGNIKFYKNGSAVGSSWGLLPNSVVRNNNYFAKSNWSWDPTFQGSMDELAIYSRGLSDAEVMTHYLDASPKVPQGGNWKLDEGAGNVAFDTSGNNNHGSLVSGPTWRSAGSCVSAGCLGFDGVDDHVTMGDALQSSWPAFSLEAWVKTTGGTGDWMRVAGRAQMWERQFGLWIDARDGRPLWQLTYNGCCWVSVDPNMDLRDDQWHHLVGIRDSGRIALYIDGALAGENYFTGNPSTPKAPLVIGGFPSDAVNWGFFKGDIDEVSFYDRALSSTEITAHYAVIGSSIGPGAPGAPTNVSATPGNASATVTWTPPADNGGTPIVSYTVRATPGGQTATVDGEITETTVSDLTNGTSYTFTVQATNSVGTGSPSEPSNVVTPRTLPGVPTNVRAMAGNAAATVSWDPPASNGGAPIDSYMVTASPGGQTASTDGSRTSTTAGGLTNGTSYTFTVTAANAAGTGEASEPSNAVTPQPSEACSGAGSSGLPAINPVLAALASSVGVGVIDAIRTTTDPAGNDVDELTMSPVVVLQGTLPDHFTLVVPHWHAHGLPEIDVGRRYLLYLKPMADPGTYTYPPLAFVYDFPEGTLGITALGDPDDPAGASSSCPDPAGDHGLNQPCRGGNPVAEPDKSGYNPWRAVGPVHRDFTWAYWISGEIPNWFDPYIHQAANAWAGLGGFHVQYMGRLNLGTIRASDGINTITFEAFPEDAMGNFPAAVTDPQNGPPTTEFDIAFNSAAPWSDNPADLNNFHPLEVALHEIGHVAGLGHVLNERQVMCGHAHRWGQPQGPVLTLSPGEHAGLRNTRPGNIVEGYYLLEQNGSVAAVGGADSQSPNIRNWGEATGPITQTNHVAAGMATTPTKNGYWIVANDGGVFTYGDAQFKGSTGNLVLNKPVVGMAAMPWGQGYWLVASDGGIFAYGDARFYDSMGGQHLNKPIVGMAPTPSGHGYWLVASDGGIFAFGDADFHGSMGGTPINQPVVGMSATPNGGGYWLAGADGGIFAFGNAQFAGSNPHGADAASISRVPGRYDAYGIARRDGTVETFGFPFLGYIRMDSPRHPAPTPLVVITTIAQ